VRRLCALDPISCDARIMTRVGVRTCGGQRTIRAVSHVVFRSIPAHVKSGRSMWRYCSHADEAARTGRQLSWTVTNCGGVLGAPLPWRLTR
jgi:hypothetical protein